MNTFYIHWFPAGQANLPKVVYWGIKELGIEALGLEQNWFLLSACRSSIVRRLPGKMSEFFKMCLTHFYCPVDVRLGIQLRLHGQSNHAMIFCRISIFLGDEGALKEVLEMKGASGSKLCCLCSNLVDHKSGIAECDPTHTLVPSTELDVSKIQRHSDESILETLRFLREKRDQVNQEEFRKLQQYCGFNLSPRGTLMSETLAIRPASCVMYDWMHTYVSNGIWNLEIQLLAQTLHDAGVSLDMLHSDLQGFCWPSFIKNHGMSGQSLFEHCQLQDIKCSASEALSVYSIIRWILVERRLKGELDRAELAVNSYLRLCRCLDLLINIKKKKSKASQLREAIQCHLQAFQRAYGVSRWLPKHHYSTHLAYMYSFHEVLPACFMLERKHKTIKRFGGQNFNTWANWERSLVTDVLRIELNDLSPKTENPWAGGLCKPTPATDAARRALQHAVGSEDTVNVALQCYYSPGAFCAAHDVVLLQLGDERRVGKIKFFFEADNINYAAVTLWDGLGQNLFNPTGPTAVCEVACIRDTCAYAWRGSYIAVPPNTCWTE